MAIKIIGAGLAGLLTGSIFPRSHIFERGMEDKINHKAVLRFRTPAVGEAVGVEFKPVTVHKGIWHNGFFARPSIQLANLYSQKVIGRLADRSIWNIEPAERYIAPEDIVAQMAERCNGRISWESEIDSLDAFRRDATQIITTIPIPFLLKLIGEQPPPQIAFKHAAITVRRWRIPNADIYQTIYFPSPETNLYRASITRDLLIAEYKDDPSSSDEDAFALYDAFGLDPDDLLVLDKTKQSFGKIAPIDNNWRRNFLHRMTVERNIFSIGRFATWRNILMDDVIKDIHIVKRMMSATNYDRALLK